MQKISKKLHLNEQAKIYGKQNKKMQQQDILKDISLVLDFLWQELPLEKERHIQQIIKEDDLVRSHINNVRNIVLTASLTKAETKQLFEEAKNNFLQRINTRRFSD